jgi:hypothetical protein
LPAHRKTPYEKTWTQKATKLPQYSLAETLKIFELSSIRYILCLPPTTSIGREWMIKATKCHSFVLTLQKIFRKLQASLPFSVYGIYRKQKEEYLSQVLSVRVEWTREAAIINNSVLKENILNVIILSTIEEYHFPIPFLVREKGPWTTINKLYSPRKTTHHFICIL